TTLLSSTEDQTINSGGNSLTSAINEAVSIPRPVFQESRIINSVNVDVYTNFFSTKYAIDSPLMNKAGFIAFDFGIFKNFPDGSLQPMRIRLHAGGESFLDNVTSVTTYAHEINMSFEEKLPSGQKTGYWGVNENYDVYDSLNNKQSPASGVNYNFVQLVMLRTIEWAKINLPVDSNRIYLEGSSLGAIGSYFLALNYPQNFAAVKLTAGVFDFGFDHDYQPNCSLNAGRSKRKEGDRRMGTIALNLSSSLGIKTYDGFDGGYVMHKNKSIDYPFVYSLNGKHDKILGWTEKTVYYDSVNTNQIGGWYFYDEGDHGANGGVWNKEGFDLFRFNKKISYPAFSNCSINEDYGEGNDTTGAAYGSVNGMLDWVNEIADSTFKWRANIFIHDLKLLDSSIVSYPDSCTVTITPRRVQRFFPPAGVSVIWNVTRNNLIVQSGSVLSDGSILIIPSVKIFKDTGIFQLSYGTLFFLDADNDGYGNPASSITAIEQPNGYVLNDDDCNDANAAVHAGATEICNGIDDDCNGMIDENSTVTAAITPSGTVNACKGDKVKLNATTGAGYLYQWNKDGVAIAGATKSSYTSIGNESGSFTVFVNGAGGCSASSAATIINRLSKPTAKITPLGDLDICTTGSVMLQASSGEGYTYKWFLNDVKIPGASNQTFTAVTTGSYTVKITNADGCSKKSTAVVVFNSCKENFVSNEEVVSFYVFPNPSNGEFTFHLTQIFSGEEVKVEIKNLVGQIIYSNHFVLGNEDNEILLPEKNPSGIYLIEVIMGNEKFTDLISVIRK
ncbi:MAG: T9SS type A sorting domain-containing protein, partial [Chitinophagales bacterium]|nr:T9SS type A sorting domain-containing protein [Chitinophagales bacterium]